MFWRTPRAPKLIAHAPDVTGPPVTEAERLEVADYVMRGVPIGTSGPCICDKCIRWRWRPLMRLAPANWPHPRDEVAVSYRDSGRLEWLSRA